MPASTMLLQQTAKNTEPQPTLGRGYQAPQFPLEFYDRPGLALANLVRGDVDATTRAIFQPDTLSPKEMQTIRQQILKKDSSPVMKTIVDIATNPMVILGTVLALSYPIASPQMLYKIGRDMSTSIPGMARATGGIHTAYTWFRDLPRMWDMLTEYMTQQHKFQAFMARHSNKALEKFRARAGRTLTGDERFLLGAYLDGWHTNKAALYADDAIKAAMGDRAPAPKLLEKMSTPLKELGDDLRRVYDRAWKAMKPDDDVIKEMASKGVELSHRNHYFPHQVYMSHPEMEAFSAMNQQEYRNVIWKIVDKGKVASAWKKFRGVALPDEESLAVFRRLGVLDEGFEDAVAGAAKSHVDDVQNVMRGRFGQYAEAVSKAGPNISPNLRSKFSTQLSTALGEDLEGLGIGREVSGQAVIEILRRGAYSMDDAYQLIDDVAEQIGTRPRYGLEAVKATEKYINTVGPTYAWFSTGLGKAMTELIDSPLARTHQRNFFKDTLGPTLRGIKTYPQMVRSATVAEYRRKMDRWLQSPFARRHIPEGTRKWLAPYFSEGARAITDVSLGSAISHWYYLSSLGFNVGSASKNIFQNLITTGLVLNPKHMAKGLGVLSSRLPRYWSLTGELGPTKAFHKVFPEYSRMMSGEADIMGHLLSGDMLTGSGSAMAAAKGGMEKIKTMMMMPFAASEKFNRLWTFYSSLDAAGADNMGRRAAGRFARDMVWRTQFPGGPIGMPAGLLNRWGPLRQFMHFPLRYLGFMTESVRMGKDPSRMNFGVIGRGMAAGAGMYTAAKNMLGVNLAPGLMTGALPSPSFPGSPFYPWPLVPPLAATIGTAAVGLHSGDWERLGTAGAMLVPGGLAARRAARTLLPKYADYSQIREDGRIPLYDKNGALISQLTPWELTARAIGINSREVNAEREAAGWLLKQRDRIRDYRRQYLNAVLDNDQPAMMRIQNAFSKQYPQLGKLSVKKSDIQAIKNRRQVTRVNRIMKGFPKDYRPLFQNMIQSAGFAAATENLPEADIGLEAWFQ